MIVTAVTAVVITVATVWKVYQCLRARLDFPLLAVTLALVFELLVQLYPIVFGSDDRSAVVLGLRTSQFLQTALIVVALFWLKIFFRSSARAGVLTRRRLVIEVAVAAAAIAACAVTVALQPAVDPALLAPNSVSNNGASNLRFSPPYVAIFLPFYAVSGAYDAWASGSAMRNALRSARTARSHLRIGLWITGSGLALLVVAVVVRVLLGAAVWAGLVGAYPLLVVPSLAIAIGLPVFFVGVVYPSLRTRLDATRVWAQRYHAFHRLRALWDRMQLAFPDRALRLHPSLPWLHRAGLRHLAESHYRRIIEIHDGLMLLSRYVDPADVGPDPDADAQAAVVAAAFDALEADRNPGERAVDLGVARGSRTLDGDGRALVALVLALEARDPAWRTA